jgi:hypothetical protein
MSSDEIEATSTRSTDYSTVGIRRESGMEAKRRRRQGEEGEGSRLGSVASDGAIALEALDCTVCYHPLRPPVFQVLSPLTLFFTVYIRSAVAFGT